MTDQKWTKEQVAERFEAAVRTLRRLPPVRVRGYISSWPEIIYTKREIAMMNQKPEKWPPTPQDISEMEETCKWINLLTEIDDRKVIWLRASRLPWKEICVKLGVARSTANWRWQKAILTITHKLN